MNCLKPSIRNPPDRVSISEESAKMADIYGFGLRLPYKQDVGGSSPSLPTIFLSRHGCWLASKEMPQPQVADGRVLAIQSDAIGEGRAQSANALCRGGTCVSSRYHLERRQVR